MSREERKMQVESGIFYCPRKQKRAQKPMATYKMNTGANLKKLPVVKLGKD